MATNQTNKREDVCFSFKHYMPKLLCDKFGKLIKVSKPFDYADLAEQIAWTLSINQSEECVYIVAFLDGFEGLIEIDENTVQYLKEKQTIYYVTDEEFSMEIENGNNYNNNTSKNSNNNRRDSRIMCMYSIDIICYVN